MKRLLILILLSACTLAPGELLAAKSDNSFHFLLEEGYLPKNLRLNIGHFDVGLKLNPQIVYGGVRFFQNNGMYAGFGLAGGGVVGAGFYGIMGKQWTFFDFLGVSLDVQGHGTHQGYVDAKGHVGVGFVW